ncbi:hypothetical protein JIN87_26355 [Pelagicoccus mobilis]|uniref:Uncharacterized protein n=1 Tax=Pelagicoccus mobilis TaxID=415221 RepID=A0A934S149_9BACT|nr:hypothetical protein [Pelagicoccus mobilis]
MIGGINKVVDGVKVPYLDFDPCTYDTNTFATAILSKLRVLLKEQIAIAEPAIF